MLFMQEVLRNFFFSGILRIAAHAKTVFQHLWFNRQ